MVSVLDATQDLLCRKLTNHFVSLCLNIETVQATKQKGREDADGDADDEDADDEEPAASEEGGDENRL